jgi:hypothetical protein
LRYIFSCVPRRAAATVSALATVGFSFDDESTVNSKDGLTVTTSGSQNLRRRSNWNLCACSFPLCTTRSPGRGRACPTLPGSAAMYAEGTASRPPTAKGLADIGVRPGSAGPALRPCGFSSGGGSCRAANKIIRIITRRAAKTASRWKNRKAGERALRYLFSCVPRRAAGSHGQRSRDRGLFLR